MKRFTISALAVLLAVSAIAPTAKPAEAKGEKPLNIHQLRTIEFDSRNKSFNGKEDFSFQQRRLAELDRRGKASLAKISLTGQRHQVLDRSGSK